MGVAHGVLVVVDVFEKFVPCDFSVIAEGVHQADGLAVLGNSDDGVGYELYLEGLEVEGQIQSQVARFSLHYSDTNLILYCSYCLLVELQKPHAEGSSAEAART